ncbi:MAG: TPM domain-containing protein [Elusimicrobia bacterium]|nr:TPM domain-containing protein [Elusimicrobiota bacterium]
MTAKARLLILLCALVFLGASFPAPAGFVSDFAGIISPEVENRIHELAYELQELSGAQIAVVSVKSLDGMSIDDYAWQLFEKWGIGEKDKDTGVLLLIAPAERKVRIETGYGFEGAIPDGMAGEIIRKDIIPYFKAGDMNTGILRGSMVLLKLMADEMGVELTGDYQIPQRAQESKASVIRFIFNILILLMLISGRFFFFPLFFLGGGHYSRGGGGFGGFGGFGGGLSGGGGASGSW